VHCFGLLTCQVHMLLKYPCHNQGKFDLYMINFVIWAAQFRYCEIDVHVLWNMQILLFYANDYIFTLFPFRRDMRHRRHRRIVFLLISIFCEDVNIFLWLGICFWSFEKLGYECVCLGPFSKISQWYICELFGLAVGCVHYLLLE
jgi:hypothetical protein